MKKNAWVNFPPTLSAESISRLHAIAYDIAANERSLTRLHAIANGTLDLRQTGCTPAIRRYRPTPEDQQRLPDTITHLYQRNVLLRYEREVILRYGR